MVITREEFNEWQELPVTKKLKERIKIDVERMMQMLITVDGEDLKDLQGRCKASINLLGVEYEDLYE